MKLCACYKHIAPMERKIKHLTIKEMIDFQSEHCNRTLSEEWTSIYLFPRSSRAVCEWTRKLVSEFSDVIGFNALKKDNSYGKYIYPNSTSMSYSLLRVGSPSFQNTKKRNFTDTSPALLPIESRRSYKSIRCPTTFISL